ncbi:unnamed protein product [Sphagnum jensenii]|uniref:Uncharacterized protein n=1 Tax=Sphagnum jensenii TaxID=128206 RepID=A0ABP1A469_9BRYO
MQLLITVMSMRLETRAFPMHLLQQQKLGRSRGTDRKRATAWIFLPVNSIFFTHNCHQWQHEHCQNQQLQLQLCSKDEKISHLTYQVACLREAMLGHRRVPVLRSSSVYHTF